MLVSDTIDNLTSLCNLDKDALQSYDTALKTITDQEILNNVKKYRDDHARHIDNLSRLITALGGTPPQSSGDIRGLFLGGATKLQGLMGTEGALKALQTGEKITNKSYADAVEQDFSPDILSVLTENFKDEKMHLEYVNKVLADKPWEHRKAA